MSRPKVRLERGGATQTVDDGGLITIKSGGSVNVESGGALKIGGVDVTAELAAIDGSTTPATLAAAGNAQSNATAMTAPTNYVTGADGTKGVKLPTAAAGLVRVIYNTDGTNNLLVYPNTSDDINDGTVNVHVLLGPKTCGVFRAMDATTWASLAPIVKQSAYTQTFSTADKTIANATAAVLTVTDGAGTNNGTIDAITADASVIAAVQELADQINKLIADGADLRQGLTAVIDDLQAANVVG